MSRPAALRIVCQNRSETDLWHRKSQTATLDVGDSRQTVWCERQLDDALATLVGYTAFLVASFRRLALLDVLHCISWEVTRRQSIWLAADVCNQRMHDERRWLVEAVWFVECRRRVILNVTRDSFNARLHLDQSRVSFACRSRQQLTRLHFRWRSTIAD